MEMQFSIATMHVKTYGVLYFKVFWIGIKKMGQKSTYTVLYDVMEDYILYIYIVLAVFYHLTSFQKENCFNWFKQ